MPERPRVSDARPPRALLALVNPVLRTLLLSPAGRLVRGRLALLEFSGRRTGRRYRIVVNWHDVDRGRAVFTPAPWRANFRGGRELTFVHAGRRVRGTGALVDEPAAVAAGLNEAMERGSSPRMLGLRLEPGQRLTADDTAGHGRALVRLDLDAAA